MIRDSDRATHSGRASSQAGFTLLEAVLALAILGIGIGVVFEGLAQGLRLRHEAADSVALSLVAERILGGFVARPEAPAETEEGEESGVRWRIEPVAAPAEPPEGRPEGLVEVQLTLETTAGRRWEMTTLLPKTAPAAP